jgi:[NiFe] hydrogenase large subunit
VRAVEDAVGVQIPDNARILRNLLHGAQYQHDHIVHFYHLHALDWVDIVSALSADPKATATLADNVSDAPWGGSKYFKSVQDRLKKFVSSGQLGPFENAYWGHSAYKLPAEANLMAASHYIEALRLQAKAARMHAIFGGKNPHPQSLVVGGMTCVGDLTPDRIAEFLYITRETQQFIEKVYIPDLLTVAGFYKDWAGIGGTTNFMAWGDFPETAQEPESLYMPRGVIAKRDLANVVMAGQDKVTEDVTRGWYEKSDARHPWKGETKPLKEDPKYRPGGGDYSWLKAPRYDGMATEVGPLARVLVAYAKGHTEIKPIVDMVLGSLGVGPGALFSTLGRTAARGIETVAIGQRMEKWMGELIDNIKNGDTATYTPWEFPKYGEGVGLNDVPRGSLGHWCVIEGNKIKNYQYVVPSTWNLCPRDAKNQKGPLEEALIGTPIADPKKPLEVLRTVHSFDPCIACAVHVIDPDSNQVYKVKAL